ncbi:type II toxin-antitoxin system RelB/DinJ family antitoxin [Pararhizobium sp. BT-229]|uniref:type II toxin-antitoxin system RelB/DinJ family antitoxin n=1 Tax=Pararhizobium sp. BT-229 TaxID=2986923 RepID=UPI0021F7A0DA|nr:type II toxin-antitoxin system RelB/DinJ family antitoxin [Pararhizobium sp. BT-229]MCV9964310.1 type II toxin-antitoxin system RelB/DinJ family antitoxin [Pararhizobium sp. BT-229]
MPKKSAATSMVHVRVDEDLKDAAARVLSHFGLTTSEAVRMFLTTVVTERGLPVGMAQKKVDHDGWFRASVREAMEDHRPTIPHEEVMASVRARITNPSGTEAA